MPPMQPSSPFAPRYRRQPALLLSDGSQHCAAITVPCNVVVAASQTQVAAGKSPLPPSST
jgi:hypothetical protein